ncbi:MAG: glycosyltransferase [Desulfatibacillaceae bacterium]|nr:glycosyltransferase [Desulfatibacillaceae bacterium]
MRLPELFLLTPQSLFGRGKSAPRYQDAARPLFALSREFYASAAKLATDFPVGSAAIFGASKQEQKAVEKAFGARITAWQPGESLPKPFFLIMGQGFYCLADPRPVLAAIRDALWQHPKSRFLAAVPKDDHPGTWSAKNLQKFLCLGGFECASMQALPVGLAGGLFASSKKIHEKLLSAHCLPNGHIRLLICTTEHPNWGYSAGIGSYVFEMGRICGQQMAVVYLGPSPADSTSFPADDFLKTRSWLSPLSFYPFELLAEMDRADICLELVSIGAFLYPFLEVIESQDLCGIGLRAIQAKRAGLLPIKIRMRVRCHGCYAHLENASGHWSGSLAGQRFAARERLCLAQADEVCFASQYLMDIYRQQGLFWEPSGQGLLRYPYNVENALPPEKYLPVDTLVFFGRRAPMKGFDIFCEAVSCLIESGEKRIRRIVILGQEDCAAIDENKALVRISRHLTVEEYDLPRSKALEFLSQNANRAVVVLPYRADNHPNCLLETVFCGCRLLAAEAGGIPELVGQGFPDSLFEPHAPALVKAITSFLDTPVAEQQGQAKALFDSMLAAQKKINSAHSIDALVMQKPARQKPKPARPGRVVLLMEAGSQSPQALKAFEAGLAAQSRFADRLLCIAPQNSQFNRPLLEEKANLPPNCIQEISCSGDFFKEILPSLDPDDILLLADSSCHPSPFWISSLAGFLEANPAAAGVCAYSSESGFNGISRPLGSGGAWMMLQEKPFVGSAAFRAKALQSLKNLPQSPDALHAASLLWFALDMEEQPLFVIPQVLCEYPEDTGPFAGGQRVFALQRDMAQTICSGMSTWHASRMAAALSELGSINRSKAWSVALEIGKNPKLVAAGKALLLGLDKIHRLLPKKGGR